VFVGGGGAASLVGGGRRWRVRVRAEEALELVEAEADERDGGGVCSRLIPLEEALPARRLPGRRRARGGLPEVGDPAARRRPAIVVVVVAEHERRERGAGRRERSGRSARAHG